MLPYLAFYLVVALLPQPLTENPRPFEAGIGVIGDSYSDEYQLHTGACKVARNWVEILAELRGLNFGEFSATSRDEPRREGFAHNWARADATTTQAIETGQHTGLAAQAADGQVQVALIFIGGNDFLNALLSSHPMPQIEQALENTTTNLDLIVDTLKQASPRLLIMLVTVPDVRNLPEIADLLRQGRLSETMAQACSEAISKYNAHIRSLSRSDPQLLLIDVDLTSKLLLGIGADSIPFGDGRLDVAHPGNDSKHVFLADGRHLGTLAQGMFAQMFLECLRAGLDAPIASLTPEEVKRFADSLPQPPALQDVNLLHTGTHR